jgi:hypothetical protein
MVVVYGFVLVVVGLSEVRGQRKKRYGSRSTYENTVQHAFSRDSKFACWTVFMGRSQKPGVRRKGFYP